MPISIVKYIYLELWRAFGSPSQARLEIGEPFSDPVQDLVQEDILVVVRVELLLVLSSLFRAVDPGVGPGTKCIG